MHFCHAFFYQDQQVRAPCHVAWLSEDSNALYIGMSLHIMRQKWLSFPGPVKTEHYCVSSNACTVYRVHSCQKTHFAAQRDSFVIAKKRSGEQSEIFPDDMALRTSWCSFAHPWRLAFQHPGGGNCLAWCHLMSAWNKNNWQRNPAQTEHGLRGKASTWMSACAYTIQKKPCPKKTMSPKIRQNSMPCSASSTKGWLLIVFVGRWELPSPAQLQAV